MAASPLSAVDVDVEVEVEVDVTVEVAVETDVSTTAPAATGSGQCEVSRWAVFAECPHCAGEMTPEHAHYRCTSCGWRDSCCD